MTPEEILMMATAPAAKSVSEFGQGGVELAKAQFGLAAKRQDDAVAHQRAMEIVNARLAGDQEINVANRRSAETLARMREEGDDRRTEWNNKAALERAEAQAKAYVDRLDESSLNQRALDLQKNGVQQKPGESTKDFVMRGTAEAVRNYATSLQDYEDRLTELQGAREVLDKRETARQASAAGAMAAKSVRDTMTPDELKVVQGREAAGLRFDQALDAIKDLNRRAELQATFKANHDLYLPQIQAQKSAEHQQAIGALDRRENYFMLKRNSLLNSPFGAAALNWMQLNPVQGPSPDPGQLIGAPPPPPPGGGQNPSGKVPGKRLPQGEVDVDHFLAPQLQNPDLQAALDQVYPALVGKKKADWRADVRAATPQGANELLGAIVQHAEEAISRLGVKVENGQITVPDSEEVMNPFGWYGGVNFNRRFSAVEKAKKFKSANEILKGVEAARKAYVAPQAAPVTSPAVNPAAVIAAPPMAATPAASTIPRVSYMGVPTELWTAPGAGEQGQQFPPVQLYGPPTGPRPDLATNAAVIAMRPAPPVPTPVPRQAYPHLQVGPNYPRIAPIPGSAVTWQEYNNLAMGQEGQQYPPIILQGPRNLNTNIISGQ